MEEPKDAEDRPAPSPGHGASPDGSLVSKKQQESINQVLNYDVLLEEILEKVNLRDLRTCSRVSLNWYKVSRQVEAKRTQAKHVFCPFRLLRFEEKSPLDKWSWRSPRSVALDLPKWLNGNRHLLAIGTDEVEKQLEAEIKSLNVAPDLMLLIEGNNTKVGKKRRWKRAKVINAIRASLPPSCRVIGIDAHFGLIGVPTDPQLQATNFPLVTSFDSCSFFGISSTFFPKYRGVRVEIFDRNTELEADEDIKALVLFSSGVAFNGDYLDLNHVKDFVSQMKGNVALGGAQVNDKLTTVLVTPRYSDDTANYYFLNGRPPYNPMYNPQKMSLIGFKFSGPNVRACSLALEPKGHSSSEEDLEEEVNFMEEQLKEFRGNLDFDPDASSRWDSVAFLFFNYYHFYKHTKYGDINSGIKCFQKFFPKTKLIGLLSHAQYEYNFWPEIKEAKRKVPISDPRRGFPSSESVASLVIVSFHKDC